MSVENVKKLRDRAWLFLTPDVAATAGLTLQALEQFVAGAYALTPDQAERLARRIGLAR